jgi:hypothetical protein
MLEIRADAGARRGRPLLPIITLLFVAQAWGQSRPAQPPPTSQPAIRETVAAAHLRLTRIPTRELSSEQIALKTTLALALAIGKADGEGAAKLLDAVGYHALPLEGRLPERSDKPLTADEFRECIERRGLTRVASLPADTFEVLDRVALRKEFAAVAEWMLPQDRAVVIRPANGTGTGWVSRSCCLVVRLRARKPTILGGNLLAVLAQPTTRRALPSP